MPLDAINYVCLSKHTLATNLQISDNVTKPKNFKRSQKLKEAKRDKKMPTIRYERKFHQRKSQRLRHLAIKYNLDDHLWSAYE